MRKSGASLPTTFFSASAGAITAFAILSLIAVAACVSRQVPPEDSEALARVRAEFGGKYRLSVEGDLYVRVQARLNMKIVRSDLPRIYQAFFMNAEGGRRDTRFVYLNAYDERGRFVIQTWRDPRTGEFRYNHMEHY